MDRKKLREQTAPGDERGAKTKRALEVLRAEPGGLLFSEWRERAGLGTGTMGKARLSLLRRRLVEQTGRIYRARLEQ